jgi:hypothetical protein
VGGIEAVGHRRTRAGDGVRVHGRQLALPVFHSLPKPTINDAKVRHVDHDPGFRRVEAEIPRITVDWDTSQADDIRTRGVPWTNTRQLERGRKPTLHAEEEGNAELVDRGAKDSTSSELVATGRVIYGALRFSAQAIKAVRPTNKIAPLPQIRALPGMLNIGTSA